MLAYEQHAKLFDDTMEVDFQLVDDGVVITDDYISLTMDGTFHALTEEATQDEEGYRRAIPIYKNDREPSQFIISEISMNSFLKATQDLDWWDVTKTVKSKEIEPYLKGFETAFGEIDNVNVTCMPVPGN